MEPPYKLDPYWILLSLRQFSNYAKCSCYDKQSTQHGFVPHKYDVGVYTKRVPKTDIHEAYHIRTLVVFMGEKFMVRSQDFNMLQIITSNVTIAHNFSFTQIAKYCFEKSISIEDVTQIYEEKISIKI